MATATPKSANEKQTPPPPGPSDSAREPSDSRRQGPPPELPPFSIPDFAGNAQLALDRLAERKGMRSENLRFYELESGGVHVVEVFPGPVQFQDDGGNWIDIDPRIVNGPGGLSTTAAPIAATFPKVMRPEEAVEVRVPGGTIASRLAGARVSPAAHAPYAVTYRDILEDVDLGYESTLSGIRELLTLRSTAAPSSFTWELVTDGVTLAEQPDGSVSVRDESGEEVARMPVPYAFDASPEEVAAPVSSALEDLGGGSYRMIVTLPRSWLDDPDRVYPVVLDPSTFESPEGVPFLKDTMALSGQPNANFSTSGQLRVGSNAGGSANSYMTFDIRKEIRELGEGQLVYSADLKLFQTGRVGLSNPGRTEVHRVTQHWQQGQVTWNAQPPNDTSVMHGFSPGCGETAGEVRVECPGWHTLPVPSLVQYWLDNPEPDDPTCDPAQPDSDACLGSNHGLRLSSPGTTTAKEFASKEAAAPSDVPRVIIVVNSLPSAPVFAPTSPADGTGIEGTTPTIRIQDVTDANGDAIQVRYQFASDRNFTNIAHDSGWLTEVHNYTVPAGYLNPDQTYHYRVQARDAEGTSKGRALPTSEVRRLTVVSKDRGYDHRSTMWRETLGNGVVVRVNEATGNLVVTYPVDSLATQAGALDLSLTYNSHAAFDGSQSSGDGENHGLGRGWSLAAGPTPRPSQLPVRVESTTDGGAATVVYQSGRREVYVAGRRPGG